ncbi:hypothetical protein VTK73DRAFT_2996 [Phialemonium thermophilum]|uniref:HTH CENPB-type domain-containing protein n=1 Tax=Phialemonium thermophilum TaxID=223376 RepID=A0ABR3Y1Z0_9PEZI
MHNQIVSSTCVDQENRITQGNNSYGSEGWVDMNASYHHTTVAGYAAGFNYIPPITHGQASESLNRMPPPQPSQTMTHPPLPMLIMPSHAAWPSMLTNPQGYTSQSAPALVIPSITASTKSTKLPAIHAPSHQRRTLTDDDRRRMCQYAEEHPTAKQTEIGALFGVERSTVSKVLRNREKYLSPESRSTSPVKRNKGKGMDIEKTLTNYVQKQQRAGHSVTGTEIDERFRKFAATVGNSAEVLSDSSIKFLERFKQKNGIGPGRLLRRASETSIPNKVRRKHSLNLAQASGTVTPSSPLCSPRGRMSPSPTSADQSQAVKEGSGHFMDYSMESGAYKQSNSQSATSLSSAFTETPSSSFAGSALSPTAPFTFSPDPNSGDFLTGGGHNRQIQPTDTSSNFHRPRSQTFPTLDLEYMNQNQNTEVMGARYHVSATAPSSALESPANEIPAPRFGLDQAVSSPHLRHSSSTSSMAARSAATSATASGAASTPNSPTQEDARRAADTLLSFIQTASGFVDQTEYMAVVRLTEKLRLHQTQLARGSSSQGIGGLSRIPEGDAEMTNAPPSAMARITAPTTMGA